MAEVRDGLVYRGHPLRRVDNLIYYGSMADKYFTCQARIHPAAADGREPQIPRPRRAQHRKEQFE